MDRTEAEILISKTDNPEEARKIYFKVLEDEGVEGFGTCTECGSLTWTENDPDPICITCLTARKLGIPREIAGAPEAAVARQMHEKYWVNKEHLKGNTDEDQ